MKFSMAPFRKLSSEISNPQAEICSKFFLEQILQYIIVVGYPPQALGKCASNSILISAASFQVKFPRGQYIYISSILTTSSWTRSVQLPSIDLAEDSVLHLYFDSQGNPPWQTFLVNPEQLTQWIEEAVQKAMAEKISPSSSRAPCEKGPREKSPSWDGTKAEKEESSQEGSKAITVPEELEDLRQKVITLEWKDMPGPLGILKFNQEGVLSPLI
ncbi:uncharacterized protein [Primulina eburnea]|uniref:uncharacterized protein n=1 Tax=Primulina eburnea TaxID=1245227 RepID=UPI003C6C70CE